MSKKKVLPLELFWPQTRIPVDGGYGVFPFANPCRKTYLSFFKELGRQISKQIMQKTGKEPDPYVCIAASNRLQHKIVYSGEPYMADKLIFGDPIVEKLYIESIQLFYKDYLYSEMEFSDAEGKVRGAGYFWIRWRSLRPEYEYINFDSGLELTEKDIIFEICDKLPREIEKQANDLYTKPEYKVDCSSGLEGVQHIKKDLPAELFVPFFDRGVSPVENAFIIKLPLDPCRKTYLSFFAELSKQIMPQVIQKIGKKPDPYLCISIDYRFKEEVSYADKYLGEYGGMEKTSNRYTRRIARLRYNGYAYAEIGFGDQLGWGSLTGYSWIRWKSLRPEYEYIDYDSGLALTDKDIRFEICTELPEEIIKQAKELYEKPESTADCNSWIEKLRSWKNVLPPELFVSELEEENWRRKGTFNMSLPVRPCRKAYLPFFRELNTQISKQIIQLTGKRPDKSLYLSVNWRLVYNGSCTDDYYALKDNKANLTTISNNYTKKMINLRHNGYCYAEIGLGCLKSNAKHPGDFWIRWKFLRPEYAYIDYDCGLELTDKDIRFEICTELPEEIAKKAESLYRSPTFKVDCNSWIDSMKNGTYLPKPRKKLPKNTKPMFPYDLSEECAYPDVFYTLWFEGEITEELKGRVQTAFVDFMDLWNEKHEEDAIHDIADAADIIEVPADAICYAVDFGNADPKAVINLLKHLHNSDLGISKALVS